MIDTKHAGLFDFLNKGIAEAKSAGHGQLLSITEKFKVTSLLRCFENAGKSAMSRAFWMNPDHSFTMVGAGDVYSMIEKTQENYNIRKEWADIQAQAIIHNPYDVPGTGLVAMGGMSFDPLKKSTSLWQQFPEKKFIVPAFVIVQNETGCFLTMNVLVNGDEDASRIEMQLKATAETLLRDQSIPKKDSFTVKKQMEIEPDTWKKTVEKAIETIQNGPIEKIVLAREMRLYFSDPVSHHEVLKQLIETQPNSYVFAFHFGEACFIGATPEQLVKIDEGLVFSMCLAGTAPRGETPSKDASLADELLNDQKNRQEHDFVVQMIRNSLEDHCEDIAIPEMPHVRQLKNLQHLYTPVTAKLKQGHDLLQLSEALHPTPALGGVPRDAALAFIREEEKLDRGWYGAPIGWMDSHENGEFAVAIRSGLIRKDQASLFAGCGIVDDSDPEAEYEETLIKLKPMLNVLGGSST
ncbi:Isochorismate synthase [Lentibacillus sp. JNUCC-1]|uniref:isochorismate synthase n=1 Tax=Lentibacillus sp. JNUCC-1 TaxID=2654513 RepID=UPI0012E89ACE|nr:isochorismate synthase [Lentibacillus sp. JNUCC-1]MUV39248.1 Isochorismate synthase [Lentibacillus sp. JNUCC-1]